MKVNVFLFLAIVLRATSQQLVNRKVCAAESNRCLDEITTSQVEVSPLFTFDLGQPTTICFSNNIETCLLFENNTLSFSSSEATTFNFEQSLFEFSAPLFQIELEANSTICLDSSFTPVVCAQIVEKLFRDADNEEERQVFFLLDNGEDSPIQNEGSEDDDNDESRDIAIGILIFQLMLPAGFIAVVIATVYKYDLVPESIKDRYRKLFRKDDVSKQDLEHIAAHAKEIQQRNKEAELKQVL